MAVIIDFRTRKRWNRKGAVNRVARAPVYGEAINSQKSFAEFEPIGLIADDIVRRLAR